MSLLKSKILKHLSEHGPATIGETAEALEIDHNMVMEAMAEMIEKAQLKRMAGPDIDPPGNVDGKYGSFNEKRMESGKSGTFEDNPWDRDIKGPKAV